MFAAGMCFGGIDRGLDPVLPFRVVCREGDCRGDVFDLLRGPICPCEKAAEDAAGIMARTDTRCRPMPGDEAIGGKRAHAALQIFPVNCGWLAIFFPDNRLAAFMNRAGEDGLRAFVPANAQLDQHVLGAAGVPELQRRGLRGNCQIGDKQVM